MKKSLAALLVAAVAVAGFSSIAAAEPAQSKKKNIVRTAVAAGQFKTLTALVKQAGLSGALSKPGNLTVFAPTDRAFAALKKNDPELFQQVASDKKLLQSVLTYHVVAGTVRAADVVKLQSAKAVSGDTITVKASDGTVRVDGANVTKTDIRTSNGVIHVIDAVILPKGI